MELNFQRIGTRIILLAVVSILFLTTLVQCMEQREDIANYEGLVQIITLGRQSNNMYLEAQTLGAAAGGLTGPQIKQFFHNMHILQGAVDQLEGQAAELSSKIETRQKSNILVKILVPFADIWQSGSIHSEITNVSITLDSPVDTSTSDSTDSQ